MIGRYFIKKICFNNITLMVRKHPIHRFWLKRMSFYDIFLSCLRKSKSILLIQYVFVLSIVLLKHISFGVHSACMKLLKFQKYLQ